MNSTVILKIFFINLFSIICVGSIAQSGISVYTDIGSNNVSNGIHVKSAAIGYYTFGKNRFEAGFQTNLKNDYKNGFSGYTLNALRNIAIKSIHLEMKGFFTRTLPSNILVETNWGVLLETKHNRFEMSIGTNFRTYNLRHEAATEYEINKNHTKIHEIYNLMYSFGYYLKSTDESWNLGLSVTNIDHFSINQETNPVLNLNYMYKISSSVLLYLQGCYKCSGITNLELNHFGYFFRTGIIWNIN